ncbi:DUF6790 family protein [Natrialba taiwanensis]|uniref:Uncharacterized protein n=1 Tax=Natrialba taiwanensis DSM 12281 TaxID=1230458 RepID=M0AA49_9EURY|nr:DUF6790 family protein [Natrialba taiwanensis]ELY95404.1 hypothetical protein C484_03915 [Natrialba taiwanensis DSM 12281]
MTARSTRFPSDDAASGSGDQKPVGQDRDYRVQDYIQPLAFPAGAIVLALALSTVWNMALVDAFLLSFLVVTVGIQGIWAFLGHYFRAETVAALIGWPAGNPFQTEIAFANLAFGILGLLCVVYRGEFWIATVIGISIFLLGAASVHIRNIREQGNLNPANAGGILVTDILTPIVLLGLLALRYLL